MLSAYRTFSVGVELNPGSCSFSSDILSTWHHNTKYYLIGSWATTTEADDPLSQSKSSPDACKSLTDPRFKVIQTTEEIPKRSSVPDSDDVDFIFINDLVRHDYCSMAAMLKEWWPKLKLGGVIGGAHYIRAQETESRSKGETWKLNHSGLPSKCRDGSDHPGGIAGAIDDFVISHGLQLSVSYDEFKLPYKSWNILKSKVLCEVEVTQFGAALASSSNDDITGSSSVSHDGSNLGRFLIPPTNRDDLGVMLEAMGGFKVGVELGVQRALNSKLILETWTSCQRYYLVDLWASQKNYEDLANVNDSEQEKIFEFAQRELEPWKNKTIWIKNFTSLAYYKVHEQVDFVYVDARHDYCGVREDLLMWWEKLRPGGVMAGHYYISESGCQDWSKCMDGSTRNGGVKDAVVQFAMEHGLHVSACWSEPHSWRTWIVRKPPAC